MSPRHTLWFGMVTMFVALATSGCADEVHVYGDVDDAPDPLVGSWLWQPDVSEIEIADDLTAVQRSDFDQPGASPSEYVVIPESDDLLLLEGWMANVPCDPMHTCDEGRTFQRNRMSYYVDAEHFLPFAMVRISGPSGVTGGAGAGVFEAFAIAETHADEVAAQSPSADEVVVVERRWRLSLEPSGRWRSSASELTISFGGAPQQAPTQTEAAGVWTLEPDGQLSLVEDGTGHVQRTLWKGDVVALDGLVFTRSSE